MLLAFVGQVYAQTTAPGTSYVVWAATSTDGASNVSITGANDQAWLAVETVVPADEDPGLTLIHDDFTPPGSIGSKVLEATGTLTNNGIFPSVMTWAGAANVLVAGKLNPTGSGTQPHLRIYTQDRDDFTVAASRERVTVENDNEHSVPHLTRDKALPAQHLCWTAKDGTENDVKTKVKDASDWLDSTMRTVSADANVVEDHCQIDFTYSGRRYTVFHKDTATTDIFLEITTWDGTTWTEVAEFGLTDSGGLDFPSVWIWNTASTMELAVVAMNPTSSNVALWRCGPTSEAGCDTATEVSSPQVTTTTGGLDYPEVFIVPRGSTTDTFVLVERDAAQDTVHLMSLCGGSGTSLTDEGRLPFPTGFAGTEQQFLGFRQSWARTQAKWDGAEFRVSFLVEASSTNTNPSAAVYHASPDQCAAGGSPCICP